MYRKGQYKETIAAMLQAWGKPKGKNKGKLQKGEELELETYRIGVICRIIVIL